MLASLAVSTSLAAPTQMGGSAPSAGELDGTAIAQMSNAAEAMGDPGEPFDTKGNLRSMALTCYLSMRCTAVMDHLASSVLTEDNGGGSAARE